ncbi:glycosyltransferase family 2 protein [Candidatus Microgenomates bacterium]|nr:glycosyltransferase family 2 protein [Candidatus Microgenomates bacterium]
MKKPQLSFVIPAYNEQDSLQKLYTEIVSVVKPLKKTYEIIFIDDGSTDSTFQVMSRLSKKDRAVRLIKLRGNFGKSIGLQIGFEKSLGDIIFTLDADLQDNPKEIPRFLKKINEGFDLVSGWKKKRHDPLTKTIPSFVVNTLVRLMSGLNIHDTNCGFKAYKKIVIQNLHLYGDLYRFIPILVHRQNFKVTEIEVGHRTRKFGKSKYGWKRFISGWLDLLTIFFLIRYLRRPGHFFGTLGVISFFFGFLIGIYITFLRITTGSIQFRHPLLFLGMLLMIVGVQLISTGLLAELTIHTRNKFDYTYAIEKMT